MDKNSIWVPAGSAGERLDSFVTRNFPELSRSQAQRLIDQGHITIAGKPVKASLRLQAEQTIEIVLPPPAASVLEPEPIPLNIIYEDSDIIVLNKPVGMVVHPAAGHPGGTLVNALLAHCPDLSGIGGVNRPGIIHRLDKDTSGLLVIAKNDLAHHALSQQMKNRSIKRRYLALVRGWVTLPQGTIAEPIGRHPRDRKRMAVVSKGGRAAVSYYQVLEYFSGWTLLEVALETGRTHQIRVHMAHLGHPVAGDPVYGGKQNPLGLAGQALHAYELSFQHPRTGVQLDFSAPLPEYYQLLLGRLRAENAN